MWVNRLQLNTSKTDLLWCSASCRQSQLPCIPLRVGADLISPSSSVRNLGIFLDADLTMRTHVQRTVAGGFAALRKPTQYPALGPDVCLPDTDCLARCESPGLWQRSSRWNSGQFESSPTVGA